MAGCPFCNYPKDEIIYETDHVYVIPDKHPIEPGHLLVIPKEHYISIMDMDESLLCELISVVKRMEKLLVDKMKVKGITIRQNWTPFLAESHLVVRHVHFHLIPRYLNDKFSKGTPRIDMSKEERLELAKFLKS